MEIQTNNSNINSEKNLYDVLINHVIEKIASDDFDFEKPIYTEKTLSEKFNVSRITAKRAMDELVHYGIVYRKRSRGTFVASDYKIKLDAILNPNDGSHLFSMKKIIAFVVPFDINKGGIIGAVRSASDYLYKNGYMLTVFTSGETEHNKQNAVLKDLLDKKIGGIILYPHDKEQDLEIISEFYTKKIPFALLDKKIDFPLSSSVSSDNYKGGYLMTKHLIELGHKNIAWFAKYSINSSSSIRDRYCGYITAIDEAGIPINMDNVYVHVYSMFLKSKKHFKSYDEFCEEKIKEMYQSGVTAIQVVNDEEASDLYAICKRLGISVPDQMNLTGFDNTDLAKYLEVSLTTMEQNFEEFGRRSSELIVESISKGFLKPVKIEIPVKLIVRNSTCRVEEMTIDRKQF